MTRLWIAGLACTLLAFGQTAPVAKTAPEIYSATANFTPNPAQLTIVGANFGTAPTVALGGTALTLVSPTPTQVVANLPAALDLSPSYNLTLR